MAIRFDAAGDRILRTANVLSNQAAYTVIVPIYAVSVASLSFVFSLNTNDEYDSNESFGFNSAGALMVSKSMFGTSATGSTLSANTWYYLAFVRTAKGGAIQIYLNGGDTPNVTYNYNTEYESAATRMEFGGATTTNKGPFNGRLGPVKLFAAALTASEIKNELYKITPTKTTVGFYPGFGGETERLLDYSANKYNWTAAGTLTDEAGPPIPWGSGNTSRILIPSSVSSVNGLTATDLTGANPTLSTPVMGQVHALTGNALTGNSPTLSSPVIGQVHALTASALTGAVPTLSLPALGQKHALTGNALTGAAPTLTLPTIGQIHALTGNNLTGSVPTLSSSALSSASNTDSLTADNLTGNAPILGSPVIGQIHALTGNALTGNVPTLTSPAMGQVHALTAINVSAGAPTLTSPAINTSAFVHALTGNDILGGSPILSSPAIGQVHRITASDLTALAPTLSIGALIVASVALYLDGNVNSMATTGGASSMATTGGTNSMAKTGGVQTGNAGDVNSMAPTGAVKGY